MKVIDNLNDYIEKMDNAKKVNPLDLSSDQDLSIAIMNLISIEEHLFFSGAKTQDTSFYDLINIIREDRKQLLQKIIKTYRGEVWCISKHLLATSMRLMEVGTKALHAGNTDEAYDLFGKSYDMYCLFWGLNINNISEDDAKKLIGEIDKSVLDDIKKDKETVKTTEQTKIEIKTESKTETKADASSEKFCPVKKARESVLFKLKGFVTNAVNCCKE